MNTFLLLKTMKNAFFFSRMRFLFVLIFEKKYLEFCELSAPAFLHSCWIFVICGRILPQ